MAQVLAGFIEERALSVDDLDARIDGTSHSLPDKISHATKAIAPATATVQRGAHSTVSESSTSDLAPSSRTSSEIGTGSGSNSTVFNSEPTEPATAMAEVFADPGLPTTQTIRGIMLSLWRTMLNLPPDLPVSEDDSFFDLGGDSILAMKFAGEARDQGVQLNVADVFRNPTFHALLTLVTESIRSDSQTRPNGKGDLVMTATLTGRHLQARNDSETDLYERFSLLAASNVDFFLQTNVVPHVGVFRGGLADVLPATDFQSLAVTGALLSSRWMLNYFYLEGCGALNVSRLRSAWFQVVQAFDILRTVFIPSGGRFLQVVLRSLRPSFRVVKLEDDNFETFTQDLQAEEREAANTPKLGESLLGFTVLMHQRSARHRLLLRISHAQYDGVCLHRIWSALREAYQGRGIPAPPLFANYLRASAGTLRSEHYRHWSSLLKGSRMTEIATAATTATKGEDRLGVEGVTSLPTTILKEKVWLPTVGNSQLTPATVIKAAWARVLGHLSGSDDVVFGHTISGRNVSSVSGVEAIVGPCLNLVPVRVCFGSRSKDEDGNCSGVLTVRQLMHGIQAQQVADMPHEVLGFREIIRHCTDWASGCYFSTVVQYQNGSLDALDSLTIGGVEYRVGCATEGGGDFADLSVFAQPLARATEEKGKAVEKGEGFSRGGFGKQEKKEGEMHEVMVSFAEGGRVTRELAQRALDLLCETAERFAREPDAEVQVPSSGSELGQQQTTLPHQDLFLPASTRVDTSSTSPSDYPIIPELVALIKSAWKRVLLPSTFPHTGAEETQHAAAADLDISDDTSFFAAGGDLVRLAELAWLLGQEGLPTPSLEDLAARLTVRDQAALLGPLFTGRVTASTGGAFPASSPSKGVLGAGSKKDQGTGTKDKGKDGKTRVPGLPLAKMVRLVKGWTKKPTGRVDVEVV